MMNVQKDMIYYDRILTFLFRDKIILYLIKTEENNLCEINDFQKSSGVCNYAI